METADDRFRFITPRSDLLYDKPDPLPSWHLALVFVFHRPSYAVRDQKTVCIYLSDLQYDHILFWSDKAMETEEYRQFWMNSKKGDIDLMNNKEYIKKGQEYLKGSKEYAYAFFVLQMVLVLASIFLFFSK